MTVFVLLDSGDRVDLDKCRVWRSRINETLLVLSDQFVPVPILIVSTANFEPPCAMLGNDAVNMIAIK